MRNIPRTTFNLVILVFLLMLPAGKSNAQTPQPQFSISLRRDFGYGGIGNDIQGLFTLRPSETENLAKVEYYLDGTIMGSVSEPPFEFQFRTGDYPDGQHTIYAIGITSTGDELRSNDVRPNFVAAEQGWRTTITIVVVVFALVFGVMIISGLIATLSRRGKKSNIEIPKSYGISGAAICPGCNRPFSRHWWGINLMVGKLERCPYCGKWSLTRRATPDELALAEKRLEAEFAPQVPKVDGHLGDVDSRELEESKYVN